MENGGTLLKGTTRKVNGEEGELLKFLAPLTRVALPLMKNILIPLAKSVLVTLELIAPASTTDAAIQKKMFGSRCVFELSKANNITISKRNGGYHENS